MLALLEGLIDYAGLFPPARLDLDAALTEYDEACAGPHAWMLERFICPATRLRDLGDRSLRLTVVIDDESAPLDREGIEVVEGKAPPGDLHALAPEGARVFAEVDPTDASALDDVARARVGAKVRCGGDAFPAPGELAAFVAGCTERELPFKATAGLHHPFRTPDHHGFVNLLAAAGLARDGADLEAVLAEEDASAFTVEEGALLWRGQSAGERRVHFVGYGSCSFSEPVDDLRKLGWIE